MAKLEILAAEDQCSTKFSELKKIAAEKNIRIYESLQEAGKVSYLPIYGNY